MRMLGRPSPVGDDLASLHSGRSVMTNFADKTIWTGDNLAILRGINSDSVDLIYLDPQ